MEPKNELNEISKNRSDPNELENKRLPDNLLLPIDSSCSFDKFEKNFGTVLDKEL